MNALAPADPYEEGLEYSANKRHFEAIEAFERALNERPNDPRVLFALGNTARDIGLLLPAQEFLSRVLALEPGRVEALVNLANLLRSQGNFTAAESLLSPALARNPDAAELWLTLGSVYREMGDAQRAAQHYRAALDRRPDYPPALGNLADLLADEGNTGKALALYDLAIEREPLNAQARLNRSILHLLRGELAEGWRDYAARLEIPGKAPQCDHGLPRWQGVSLKGTRLLVTAEQGVGDQLMFASMIGDLASRAAEDEGSVILEGEPPLVTLFAGPFPRVKVRPCRTVTMAALTTSHYDWLDSVGGADTSIELGSLPRILRRLISLFPKHNAYLP